MQAPRASKWLCHWSQIECLHPSISESFIAAGRLDPITKDQLLRPSSLGALIVNKELRYGHMLLTSPEMAQTCTHACALQFSPRRRVSNTILMVVWGTCASNVIHSFDYCLFNNSFASLALDFPRVQAASVHFLTCDHGRPVWNGNPDIGKVGKLNGRIAPRLKAAKVAQHGPKIMNTDTSLKTLASFQVGEAFSCGFPCFAIGSQGRVPFRTGPTWLQVAIPDLHMALPRRQHRDSPVLIPTDSM